MSRDDLTVMSTQDFSSLPGSIIQVPLHIFYVLPEGDVLAMAPINQQADSISYTSGIRVFQPLTHTPPR